MPKFPASETTIRFVADQLALQKGSRDAVAIADIRSHVSGAAETIAAHFATWQSGLADDPREGVTEAVDRRFALMMDALVGAVKESAQEATEQRAGRRVERGKIRSAARLASETEMKAVLRAAFEDPAPGKGFLAEVIDREPPKQPRIPNLLPPGASKKKKKSHRRRPDAPVAARREHAADRLKVAREIVLAAKRRHRRVRKSDWTGAVNTYYTRLVATVLREEGRPLMPAQIAAKIEKRWGNVLGRPARNLPPQLRGSSIAPGKGGRIWFFGEDAPDGRKRDERRDTETAWMRQHAETTFGRALDILRERTPSGMSVGELSSALGEAIGDFNRDWLSQRLKRAVKDEQSNVRKVDGGYAWAGGAARPPDDGSERRNG